MLPSYYSIDKQWFKEQMVYEISKQFLSEKSFNCVCGQEQPESAGYYVYCLQTLATAINSLGYDARKLGIRMSIESFKDEVYVKMDTSIVKSFPNHGDAFTPVLQYIFKRVKHYLEKTELEKVCDIAYVNGINTEIITGESHIKLMPESHKVKFRINKDSNYDMFAEFVSRIALKEYFMWNCSDTVFDRVWKYGDEYYGKVLDSLGMPKGTQFIDTFGETNMYASGFNKITLGDTYYILPGEPNMAFNYTKNVLASSDEIKSIKAYLKLTEMLTT